MQMIVKDAALDVTSKYVLLGCGLAQVHSLDQSTIRVIQHPIRSFLKSNPERDGEILPNFHNGADLTIEEMLRSSFSRYFKNRFEQVCLVC